MPIEAGPLSHHTDQLVVDLGHVETVETMLRELGIRHAEFAPDDQDELLGLARLRELHDADGDALDVGGILTLLRQRAAAAWGGWTPTMGKNRVVDAVIGEGHKPMSAPGGGVAVSGHKPMAGADPQPADGSAIPDAAGFAPDAGRGVRIGMVDTPLAPTQPGTTEHPLPFRAGHAEFVASLIRQQAPAAQIHVEGILNPATGRSDSWDTARAMLRLAATRQIDILNLSIGCYTFFDGPPLVLSRAIERLSPQVFVVAAAGNHGALTQLTGGRIRHSPCWPATIPATLAVGSVDKHGDTPVWSPLLPWVGCSALGVDVVGSYLTGAVETSTDIQHFAGYAQWSGTSFSTATVTGAIAAHTVPGSVSPRQALAELLAKGTLVQPFTGAS
jgi:membrane-anchored mycosin MYCP